MRGLTFGADAVSEVAAAAIPKEIVLCLHDRVTKVFQGSGSSTRSSALPYIGTVIGMEAMDSELGEDVHGDVTTLFKIVWDCESAGRYEALAAEDLRKFDDLQRTRGMRTNFAVYSGRI